MRRIVLVPVLVVLILLAVSGGIGYYIYNNYTFYTTDDAQVSGSIVSVSAPAIGELTTLSVKQNDTVTAGQTIATISPIATTLNGTRPADITIASPINGTVLQTPAVQGQTVAPGLALIQVTDLSKVTITAYVDENILDSVKTQQDVDIHIDAYGGTSYTGKVQQIVQATAGSFSLLPTQDNASGNFTKVSQRIPVIISIDGNSGKAILPGMSAEVTIHLH